MVIAMKTRLITFFLSSLSVYVGFESYSFLWLSFGLFLFWLAAKPPKLPKFSLKV